MTIAAQAETIAVRLQGSMRAAIPPAINAGAHHLRALAIKAAAGRGARRQGKRLWQSIRVQSATPAQPRAVVYLDTSNSGVPHAAAVHQNYNGYRGLTNKSGGHYMYIPLSNAANKHALHAKDTEQLGLAGWLVAGAKSRPVGAWTKEERKRFAAGDKSVLDFILKRAHDVPANKRAGFLTGTAARNRAGIMAEVRTTLWERIKYLYSRWR